jgi:hypothetical protein
MRNWLWTVDLQMSMARSFILSIGLHLRQVVPVEITLVSGHQISNSVAHISITDSLAWTETQCIWGLWPFPQILWMHKVHWYPPFYWESLTNSYLPLTAGNYVFLYVRCELNTLNVYCVCHKWSIKLSRYCYVLLVSVKLESGLMFILNLLSWEENISSFVMFLCC